MIPRAPQWCSFMACKKPPQAGRQWLILCETILGLEKTTNSGFTVTRAATHIPTRPPYFDVTLMESSACYPSQEESRMDRPSPIFLNTQLRIGQHSDSAVRLLIREDHM